MKVHVINCIETCHREQVNKFENIFYMQIAVSSNFEQLCFLISQGGGGNWEKPSICIIYLHYPVLMR